MRNRDYEMKDGQKRYVTEIVAEEMILLDKKAKTPGKGEEPESGKPLPF